MYLFKGKTLKTVAGLVKAIANDAGAIEVSGVSSTRIIRAWAIRDSEPCATYTVSVPDGINPTTVTRIIDRHTSLQVGKTY